LKAGWEAKKLGDVLSLEYGKPLPKERRNPNGIYPVYGANGIKARSDEYFHDNPTVIVGRKGSAGEINLTDGPFWPLDVTYFVKFDETKYDLRYLYWLLVMLRLPKLAKGVKPGINRNDVYALKVFIPVLKEQRRIVAILDEAYDCVTTATANAETNLRNAHELYESHVNSIVAERSINWAVKRFGEVCNFVRGPFGGSLKKSCFKPSGYAVYEQQHAIHDQFERIRYFIDTDKFEEMKRFEVSAGDLLMSCSGTMGKVAVVPNGARRGIINQALLKLTPGDGIDGQFLKIWMSSRSFQDAIAKQSQGAAIKNVASVKILKQIEIPCPALKDQDQLVADVNAMAIQVTRLETICRQKTGKCIELQQSVLEKALAGGLSA